MERRGGRSRRRVRWGWEGRPIACSGATGWTDARMEAAAGSDVFFCEASSYEQPIPYHLTYHTVCDHRERFGTARLILTHMGADTIARAGKLSIECAHDGQQILLPPRRGRR